MQGCRAPKRGEVVTGEKWNLRKRVAGFEMAESCICVVEVMIVRRCMERYNLLPCFS